MISKSRLVSWCFPLFELFLFTHSFAIAISSFKKWFVATKVFGRSGNARVPLSFFKIADPLYFSGVSSWLIMILRHKHCLEQ
jgi:uncharacterized membrane protein (DUF485 family)